MRRGDVGGAESGRGRVCAVPGVSGQDSSLPAQAEELARLSVSGIVGVYSDKASGLRETRPGLTKLLKPAAAGKLHRGACHPRGPAGLVAASSGSRCGLPIGASPWRLSTPRAEPAGVEELLADFMSWWRRSRDGCTGSCRNKRAAAAVDGVANTIGVGGTRGRGVGKRIATAVSRLSGLVEKTGAVVPTEMVVARVAWFDRAHAGLAAAVIAERWTEKALEEHAGGVGQTGGIFPARAIRRCAGWAGAAWRAGPVRLGSGEVLRRMRRRPARCGWLCTAGRSLRRSSELAGELTQTHRPRMGGVARGAPGGCAGDAAPAPDPASSGEQ